MIIPCRWIRIASFAGLLAGCAGDAAAPMDAGAIGNDGARDGGSLGAPIDAGSLPTAGSGGTAAMGADAATDGDSGTAGSSASDGGVTPAEPLPPIVATERSATTLAWWGYTRSETHAAVTSLVDVPMRDGTTLGCTLSRPGTLGIPASGRFPGLVVELTPYAFLHDVFVLAASFFTTRGYNAIVCTVRGVGRSGGTWQHASSAQERLDAYDLVEWLAAQPYSDGRMGQLGESYGGQTTYGAAVEQAPSLRAIAPMQPPSDLYRDVNYPGGVELRAGGGINNWPPIAEFLSLGAIPAQPEYDAWRAHPTYDEFWQSRSLLGRHDAIRVPVLTIGGWLDGYFRSGTLANIEAAPERTWAIYGPFTHLPVVDLGTCHIACVEDPLPSGVLLAWFDHWVMELPGVPIPEKPTFVSYENPKGGAGRGYQELSTWHAEGSEASVYELGSDGSLSVDAEETEPVSFMQPGEQSDALTFSTPPLHTDRVLIGHPRLELRATLSAGDANFYVELLDVDEADGETLVNDGFLKASHRESSVDPEPVPAGQAIDYAIAIRPQHYRFAAGHRVRIRIWGGPEADIVQLPPVEVTIETGASTLRLPSFAAPR